MTGKEMCERISEQLKLRFGVDIDPKKVWEMSPTGEIFPVVELFETLFPQSVSSALAKRVDELEGSIVHVLEDHLDRATDGQTIEELSARIKQAASSLAVTLGKR